jgi:hypothetical protein
MITRRSGWTEKRQAPRRRASGKVRLSQANLMMPPLEGRLLDRSDSGFRVRHQHLTMTSGQEVEFEVAGASGRARAVWTRIIGGEAETGFYILPG